MIALFCVLVVAASLIGGALPLATKLTHTRLQLYLSLSAGAMLGAAFFHMLPDAVELGSPSTLNWAAGGLLTLFFVERFFAFHHHEAPEIPDDPCPSHPHEHAHGRKTHAAGLVAAEAPGGGSARAKGVALHWGAAACGLALHTLFGGIALAGAAAADLAKDGTLGAGAWGVFVATIVHKPADALTITSLMLRAGTSRFVAHLVNFGFSLMIPLGAAVFMLGSRFAGPDGHAVGLTAATLAFSGGTFLCIALGDLLPELQFHEHDRIKLSAALLLGVGIMAFAGLFE